MSAQKSWEKFVKVKKSAIHGKGIFADADIPKGALVMMITGEVIDGDECLRREYEEDNVYIFWNGDTYIDTAKTKKIKYINHDCNPNCIVDDGDESSLKLIADRNIAKGEEITIDYGYEEIYEDCRCSSCRAKAEKKKRKSKRKN